MSLISPDMRLTEDFIKKTYAASVTRPDFPDEAIAALEEAGHTEARRYYENWVQEYEEKRKIELREATHWYAQQCRKEARERERRVSESRRAIQSLTKKELTELCQRLLREGIIETPEQFATAVLQNL